MAKAAESAPASMDRGELRKLLKFALREPVHVAFALGGDGKAVLQMDKRKQPRALEKALKEDADTKNHRFGTVVVNPEFPTLARFIVNKPSSGMARKLVIALKGTGFRYVEIGLEDGSAVESAQGEEEDAELFGHQGAEDEDDDEEEDEGAGERSRRAPPARPRLDVADAADSQPDSAPADPDAEPAPAGAAPQSADPTDPLNTPQVNWPDPLKAQQAAADPAANQGPPDAATLTRTLTGLVKRMLGVIAADPGQKVALTEFATDAQVSLKRGDLEQAAAGIEILREALDPAPDATAGPNTSDPGPAPSGQQAGPADNASPDQPAPDQPAAADGQPNGPASAADAGADPSAAPPSPAAVQRYHKSRTAWVATRLKVDAELRKLNAEIMAANDENEFGDDLETNFSAAVAPVLTTLDESLAQALDQAARAGSAAESAQYIQQARATIDRYTQYVSSNKIISELDDNPFVKLAIGKTLNATLSTLSAMMR